MPVRVPVLAAVGLGAAAVLFLVRGPLSSDDAGPDCPADHAGTAPAGPGAVEVEGDPEGDGCPTVGVFRPEPVAGSERMVLSISVDGDRQRIAIGEPGDQLVLGDWDCDGVDTPALYRTGSGDVLYFDAWPRVEQQRYQPDRTEAAGPGGSASLAEGDGDRCDRIEVASSEGVS
jgi:hypothetical protein